MDKEWKALRDKHVWDETLVREWADFAREAIAERKEVHFGWLFGICGEKNYELAEGDPLRKFKGRVVFTIVHLRRRAFQRLQRNHIAFTLPQHHSPNATPIHTPTLNMPVSTRRSVMESQGSRHLQP